MKKTLELLQELSSMINSDKYPKIDGSHRLDHWKANKMIIEIVNEVKQMPKAIENPLFTQSKNTVPDQTRQQVREYTDLKDQIHELATTLRDLHDAQNGPGLERDREEYAAVMVRVVEVLDKVGY